MKKQTAALAIAAAIVIVAAAYAAIVLTMPQPSRYDNLAQCLTANGAIMYGTQTCHACIYQRQLLGSSVQYINEVDCIQQYQVCMNQQIGAMPTWLINGTFYPGVKMPEELANISGCAI